MTALEPTFSEAEVLAHLKIQPRTLHRRLAENPEIRPMRNGRQNVYTLTNVRQLEEAGRCRYLSSRRVHASKCATERHTRTASISSEVNSLVATTKSQRRRETKSLLSDLRQSSNCESSTVVSLALVRP